MTSNSKLDSFDLLHPLVQHHVVNTLGWPALRPTQEMAIGPILSGRDVVLLAPTAGGKTEAAMLPTLTRMHAEQWGRPAVLYLAPIRALLNNLAPRVEKLSSFIGRRAAVWHGDIGDSQRRRILADPPDVLLTTPESLEAMLISKRVEHRALFADLRTVIIDELHAFGGDDRGWHLQAVVTRLEKLAGRRLQRIGLSATLGNPQDLAAWLAGPSTAPAEVIDPGSGAPLAPELVVDYVGTTENAATLISRLHAGEKRLVFCDSRARVEEIASHLRAARIETYVSHSSLSQDERRRAEQAFAEGQDCVIVATSTLELGLDVGDLDRVIQIDAPASVSSFLQRMGRTGRRDGAARNCLFLTTEPDAFLQACALLLLWSRGFVEAIRPPEAPWHLFGQQIMAMILESPRLYRAELLARALQAPPFASLGTQEAEAILGFMLEREILFDDGGVLGFADEGEKQFGRRHFMDLVSAFTTEALFMVRHGRSELGSVHPKSFVSRDGRPPVLLLGGRSWVVGEIDWKAHVAWVDPTPDEGRSLWPGSSRALHATLCRAVRDVLAGEDVDRYLSKRARVMLDELRQEFAWVDRQQTTLVTNAGGQSQWWTFAGLLANGMLAAGLERQGCGIRRFDNYSLSLEQAVSRESFLDLLKALSESGDLAPQIQDEWVENLKFSATLPLETGRHILELRQSDHPSAAEALREPLHSVLTFKPS